MGKETVDYSATQAKR